MTPTFIYGSGRCGSTLLELMLNEHPEVITLGEVSTAHVLDDGHTTALHKAQAREPELWRAIDDNFTAQTGLYLDDVRWADMPRWRHLIRARKTATAAHIHDLYEAAASATGAQVVIDSTKRPQRLAQLIDHRVPVSVIALVRDGRAVANSYSRRYDTFVGGLIEWMLAYLAAPWFRHKVGRHRWLTVHYERLTVDPGHELQRISDFLGITFDDRMLAPGSSVSPGIGGSPTTRSDVGAIRLDERWRHEMPTIQRVGFGLAAGWLNRLYGYR